MKLSTGKVSFPLYFDNGDVEHIFINPHDAGLKDRIRGFETSIHARLKKINLEKHKDAFVDGIDMSNVKEFGKFMKKMEDRYHSKKYYPSSDYAQFFSDRKSMGRGIPVSKSGLRKAFKKWMQENAI